MSCGSCYECQNCFTCQKECGICIACEVGVAEREVKPQPQIRQMRQPIQPQPSLTREEIREIVMEILIQLGLVKQPRRREFKVE